MKVRSSSCGNLKPENIAVHTVHYVLFSSYISRSGCSKFAHSLQIVRFIGMD